MERQSQRRGQVDYPIIRLGGLKRRDEVQPLLLESGDAFVFGGAARLRYHGVSRIIPGTAPAELGIDGRFNLTFRKY